jgi:hypothetical protein
MKKLFTPISMREWVEKEPPMSSTTYKAVWTVWLWIFTGFFTLGGGMLAIVVSIVELSHGHVLVIPEGVMRLYDSWLFALVAFSGVTTAEFYGKRKTHTPTVEAEARKEEAKAAQAQAQSGGGGGSTSTVNVEQAETVNTGGVSPAEVLNQTPTSKTEIIRSTIKEPDLYIDDERGDPDEESTVAKPMMLAGGVNANWGTLREKRIGIMLHYDASANDAGAVQWLKHDPRCQVSYTDIVLDNGTVISIAPRNRRAWHAGVCRSSDPRLVYKDANSAFYGIAIAATAGDTATLAQKQAVDRVCEEIFAAEGWNVCSDAWRIVGHDTEAWPRGRKNDPIGSNPKHPVLSTFEIRGMVASST